MNRLPPELVNLITTTLSSSPIDQLSFLTAHPNHLNAFNEFSSSCEKFKFASHFGLPSESFPLDFCSLCEIYQGLQRLVSGTTRTSNSSESRFQYSLDRRRGFLLDKELTPRGSRLSWLRSSSSASKTTNSKEWARKQITNGTFAFALEPPDQFVLVHTLNGKQFCSVTQVRLLGNSGGEDSSSVCSSFHLPYEVMGQDLWLYRGLLFLMPLSKKTKDEKLILIVLDLAKEKYEEKARFYWPSGRRPPNVYKESGERRLYTYGDRLVQILPSSDTWSLLVYDISQMQLIRTLPLSWADPSVIGQLFCADQQGPHLLLAFFGRREKHHQEDNTYPAKVVTFDIEASTELLEVEKTSNARFDLDVPVAHIQLFLCAISDYKIDLRQQKPGSLTLYHHHDHRIYSRPNRLGKSQKQLLAPLVIFLFPEGNLTSNATYQDLILPLPPSKYPVVKQLWEHNELIVKDTRVFVMHKIPTIGLVVYSTDLNLNLLWTLELSDFPMLHCETQRLFLYASHGCVWLSDAQGCLLVDQEKGLCRGHYYSYPKYTRQLPELESLHEDTSPYAQTGFSVWHIQAAKNALYIVHDIERCSPVVLDKVTM